jgi:putative FmdB family regulatory protein
MPTYDYKCDACGHEFEEFQYFSEEPLTKCPQCAANSLRRLFGTGAAVLFKGSGFYETDYRSESYKSAAKADAEAAKPATSKDSTNGTTSSKSGETSRAAPKSEANNAKSDT